MTQNATDGSTSIESNGAQLRILGNSGKMAIKGLNKDEDAAIISFEGIFERDASGTVVGQGGAGKHSIETFANQKFEFGELKEATIGTSKAVAVDFVAQMDIGAKLTVVTYIISEAGTIDLNGTKIPLLPGEVKFNVMIENWPFCSANGIGNALCQEKKNAQVGEYLDFQIQIVGKDKTKKKTPEAKKGKDDPPVNDGILAPVAGPKTEFDLGNNVGLVVPSLYNIGTTWYSMPDGYPLLEETNKGQVFTMRFSRFDAGVMVYDPIVTGVGEDSSRACANQVSVVALVVLALLSRTSSV